MASIFNKTRHFAMLHSCRGFSSVISRRVFPNNSLAITNVLSKGPRRFCAAKVEIAKKSEAAPAAVSKSEHSSGVGIADKFHHPSLTEKRLMVWAELYPSMDAIPKTVSHQSILKAKDMMRVVITYALVAVSSVIAIIILLMSRNARDRGDSLTKRKLEWRKALEEQGQKERDQAAAKATGAN